MKKLSQRLYLIASQIDRGETMADIGTDHGFLPAYLMSERICPKVIMTDISQPSLEKGIENFPLDIAEKTDLKVDFRLGDGLNPIGEGEVDLVVMAGMGGLLMVDLLSDNMKKTTSIKKYIFQPRNNIGHLRMWLVKNGFFVKKEQLVREGKYICTIITVGDSKEISQYNETLNRIYSKGCREECVWDFPPYQNYWDDVKLAGEYIEINIKKKMNILKKIAENLVYGSDAEDKRRNIERDIVYLAGRLKEIRRM